MLFLYMHEFVNSILVMNTANLPCASVAKSQDHTISTMSLSTSKKYNVVMIACTKTCCGVCFNIKLLECNNYYCLS